MHSSTFSFDRAANGFALRSVMWAIAIGVVLLLTIEVSWRAAGAVPGYVDSKSRWSWVRMQVAENPGVALLGASRMQFGFSFDAFRDRYSDDASIQQLAVAGSWPYAALRDLANDKSFDGMVVISFTPDIVMPFRRFDQVPNVEHFHDRWNIDVRLNFITESLAEKLLVTRHHNYGLNNIIRRWINSGELPPAKLYLETKFNREIDADYSMENKSEHQARRINEANLLYDTMYPVSLDIWNDYLQDFLDLTQAITQRGGCVIAVRFPSQGALYDKEMQLFPKNQFWNTLENIPFIGTVHFEEMNIMGKIDLPDLQHVEKGDKYLFTTELLKQIESEAKNLNAPNCKFRT